ncbi:MAG: SsrA-binding protein SmpB [Chloroflexi bacterium]|nr:SsrA-binding protein SmpB [Chloroflexota bacterium]
MANRKDDESKTLATNRKAFHDYSIEETYEAGIALTGTEIKSVRAGSVNLRDSYAQVRNGELWLMNVHVAPYEPASRQNVDPYRDRKLLMHRKEILRLASRAQEKGLTLIPLKMYLKKNRAKMEIGLARGKKLYDKRDAIAKRETEREIQRATKARGRE